MRGFPAHSFTTLVGDLSNIPLNCVVLPIQQLTAATVSIQPTLLQSRAYELPGVGPNQAVHITATG